MDNEKLREMLSGRIGAREIKWLCLVMNEDNMTYLYSLIDDDDERVGYNALWVFTHLSKASRSVLYGKRNELIDRLLITSHTGKRRLLLTILERHPTEAGDVRTDYLDFCLTHINSTSPYAIRGLCIKEAFTQCRYFPELMSELESELEMLEYKEMSPAMKSVKRNIRKKIADFKAKGHN